VAGMARRRATRRHQLRILQRADVDVGKALGDERCTHAAAAQRGDTDALLAQFAIERVHEAEHHRLSEPPCGSRHERDLPFQLTHRSLLVLAPETLPVLSPRKRRSSPPSGT
jgi:hypothetical protein